MAKKDIHCCPELKYIYSISFDRNNADHIPHRHPFWELILFERGEGTHMINGEVYPFRPGDIVLLSPTDIHCITNAPGQTNDCTKVRFSYNIWHNHLRQSCHFDRFPVIATLQEQDYCYALQLLKMLHDEHKKQTQTDNAAFSLNLLASLVILTQRNLMNPIKTDASKTRNILLYLQEHFCEPITITDAAIALNYSPKYFSRLFVNEVGIPFHEYIKDLRLNYAYHLIKYSELPVSDICYSIGFSSPSYFSKSFRQKYGISPLCLRNQAGKPHP